MGTQGFGVAQVGTERKDLQTVEHMKGTSSGLFGAAGCHIKGKYGTPAAVHLAHGQFVLRVAGQAGVMHPCHCRVRLQPMGQLQRQRTLRTHAQAECFQTFEHHPGVEGRQHHPGVFLHREESIDHHALGRADGTGHDPALPVQELGARMGHDVSAHLDRALQRRRGKAVVHGQPGAGVVGQVGQCGNIADLGEGVGGGFSKQQPRVRPDGGFPGGQVGLWHRCGFDAEAGKFRTDQLEGGSEHRLRIDHVIARLEQAEAHQHDGRHARRRGQAGLGPLHRRQTHFQAGHRRVARATVGVPLLLTGKPTGRDVGAGLYVAAGQVQGFGVFAVRAALGRGADGQRIAMQLGGQRIAHGLTTPGHSARSGARWHHRPLHRRCASRSGAPRPRR